MHVNSDALVTLLVNHHKRPRTTSQSQYKLSLQKAFSQYTPSVNKNQTGMKQNIFNLFRNKTGERKEHALKCRQLT